MLCQFGFGCTKVPMRFLAKLGCCFPAAFASGELVVIHAAAVFPVRGGSRFVSGNHPPGSILRDYLPQKLPLPSGLRTCREPSVPPSPPAVCRRKHSTIRSVPQCVSRVLRRSR